MLILKNMEEMRVVPVYLTRIILGGPIELLYVHNHLIHFISTHLLYKLHIIFNCVSRNETKLKSCIYATVKMSVGK